MPIFLGDTTSGAFWTKSEFSIGSTTLEKSSMGYHHQQQPTVIGQPSSNHADINDILHNDVYITVIVKQMMVEFIKSTWKFQDTRLELWNAHEHINKDTDK